MLPDSTICESETGTTLLTSDIATTAADAKAMASKLPDWSMALPAGRDSGLPSSTPKAIEAPTSSSALLLSTQPADEAEAAIGDPSAGPELSESKT